MATMSGEPVFPLRPAYRFPLLSTAMTAPVTEPPERPVPIQLTALESEPRPVQRCSFQKNNQTSLACAVGTGQRIKGTIECWIERKQLALVLCTGADPALMRTRQLLLERVGHTVVNAMNDKELAEVCERHKFDVAVIGQALSPNAKKRVAALIRERCDGVKLLELYSVPRGRALDDADSWLEVPAEVPQDLAELVTILGKAS
jgi:hypothetical protein